MGTEVNRADTSLEHMVHLCTCPFYQKLAHLLLSLPFDVMAECYAHHRH